MARQKNNICRSCQRLFRGRADAKTCSPACRKRLQRAASVIDQDLIEIKEKIESSLAQLDAKMLPGGTNESGFVGDGEATPNPVSGSTAPAAQLISPSSPIDLLDNLPADSAGETGTLDNTFTPANNYEANQQGTKKLRRLRIWQRIAILGGAAAITGLFLFTLFFKHPANNTNTSVTNISKIVNSSGSPVTNGDLSINFDTVISKGKSLTVTGPVLLHNISDSTAAFSVQNAAGNDLLVIDTKNNNISAHAPVRFYGTSPYYFNFQAGGLTADRTFTLPDASGVICIDANNCGYASAAQLSALQTQVNSQSPTPAGVTSLNGLNHAVNLQGTANQITIGVVGNTITLATPQDIGTGATPQFQSINLAAAGTQNGSTICDSSNNCGFGVGGGLAGSGTTNTIPRFINSTTLGDSNLSQSGGTITVAGDLNITGQVQIAGSQIASTDLADSADLAKLSAGQTFTGANIFSNASNSFTGSGAGLTALNASNISSGTLNDARLSANVTLQGNTFNGANQLVQLTAGGLLPVLDGSNLTNVDAATLQGNNAAFFTNASNISSGTLSDARLSANVALLNGTGPQTFTGNNKYTGTLLSENASNSTAAFQVQNAAGNQVLTVDTSGAQVVLGKASTLSGKLAFNSASGSGSITISPANPGASSFILTLPAETGTICTTAVVCAGYSAGTGGSGYVQLQGSTPGTAQTGNFNVTGTGIAGALYQGANQVCDTSGNCVGTGGGGSIGGSGTAGTIALFTGSGFTIGDSVLTQSGSTVTATSNLNVTGQYQVGGSQIASSNLSDSANLAKLDGTGPQTFTGNNKFTGTVLSENASDSTAAFQIQNSAGKNVFTADTTGKQIVLGNSGASGITGTLAFDFSGTTGSISLVPLTPGSSNFTLNLPAENGTLCSTGSVCTGYAPGSGGGGYVQLQGSSPGSAQTGNSNITGTAIAGLFSGSGASLTSLNATNVSTGTLNDARLSANVALLNGTGPQTFTGNNKFTGTLLSENTADSTAAFQIQNQSGNEIFTADTSGAQIVLGKASTLDGKVVFKSAGNTGSIIVAPANPGSSSFTLTLPAENGTLCTTAASAACTAVYSAATGGSGYVQLQGSTPGTAQTGHFNITGTGIAGTLQATNVDAASGVTLNVGNSNATGVSLCNSAACDTVTIGTNADADTITIGDSSDTTSLNGGASSTITFGNFAVAANGNVTAGTYNTDTLNSTALTFSGANPVISASTTDTGLTLQANGTGTLTLNTTGAGTVNVGTTNSTTIGIGNTTAATTTTIQGGTGSSALSIQAGSGGTISVGTAANNVITIGGASQTSTITLGQGTGTNTISIGGAAGNGATQTISIGTSGTSGSTTNVTIGSTIAGLTTLQSQGGVAVTTLGTANTVSYLCRNSSNIISTCQGGATGSAFVQGGNSFGATAVLGTNDSNSLTFETNNVTQATIAVGGATTFKNSTDSAAAFQIQDTIGAQILNIDTTNIVNNLDTNATNNLIIDGSFESGISGWSLIQQGSISQDSTQPYIGLKDLKFVTGGVVNADTIKYNLTTTTLASNSKYTFSFAAKLAPGQSMSTMRAGRSADGTGPGQQSCMDTQTVVSTGWTYFTCTFDTTTTSGTPYVYIDESDSVGRTIYIDAVQLTKFSVLTNASVEQTLTASDWVKKGNASDVVSKDATQFEDGANSLKIVTTANAGDGTKHNVTLADSTNYSLTFYALNTGAAFATMEAGYSSDGSTDDTPCATAQTVSGSWTKYTCRFNTPASHSGTPYFYVKQTNGVVHTFFIDAVQLTAGNPVSNYKEGAISLNGIISSPTTFQNQSDSTAAFQVRNSNGDGELQVDTTNNAVTIGNLASSLSSSSALAIQGNVNGSADFTKMQNANVSGYEETVIYDNTGTHAVSYGYGNASAAAFPSQFYIDTVSKSIILSTNSGTTANQFIDASNGGAVAFKVQADSTTAFTLQDAGGVSIFTEDTTNRAITIAGNTTTFATLTIANAHFKATQTTAPTIGAATCTGTPTITAGSTDSAGSFSMPATSSAACVITVTFNKAYGAGPKSVILTPKSSNFNAVQAYVSSTSTTTFVVTFAASATNGQTYSYYYWVVE